MSELVVVDGPSETAVATVTLNRPEKRNALSIALRDEISTALDDLAAAEGVKVVVVAAAGPVFSAGFDLDEFDRLGEPGFADKLWASSDRFHRTVLGFPLPLVASVNGAAIGGGFDLAVMCDLRVASQTARFSHPELEFVEVVYAPLQELVGGAVARDLCLTGRIVEASEALSLNLVSRVVAPGALAGATAELAARMAAAPRDVLLKMKAKIVRRSGIGGGTTLDL